MTKHSKFSPSGSYLWLNCAKSLDLQFPDGGTSEAAERGTFLHSAVEKIIEKEGFDPGKFVGFRAQLKGIIKSQTRFKISGGEVDDIADTYKDFSTKFIASSIQGVLPSMLGEFKVSLEERVKMDHIIPGCFGTADIVSGWATDSKVITSLVVGDWKFGRIEVDPDSPQLFLYMMGLFKKHPKANKFYQFILQPKARYKVTSYSYGLEEMRERIKDYTKRARRNLHKRKTYSVGSWCDHFASCRTRCPKYREESLKKARKMFAKK